MEELIICSPKGMPNKERYLNEELAKIKKRKICSIKMKENGDIQILLDKETITKKYFIKIVNKTEEDYSDFINFIDRNQEAMKLPKLVKHLEYDSFFVLFFKK